MMTLELVQLYLDNKANPIISTFSTRGILPAAYLPASKFLDRRSWVICACEKDNKGKYKTKKQQCFLRNAMIMSAKDS